MTGTRIVALTGDAMASRVRRALGPRDELLVAGTMRSLLVLLHGDPARIALVEPDLVTEEEVVPLQEAALYGGAALVLALRPGGRSGRTAVALVAGGATDVWTEAAVARVEVARLRIQHHVVPSAGIAVLRRIGPRLLQLPSPLTTAVLAMFGESTANDSPKHLAACSGMTRRSLDRWMVRAGFTSSRLLVAAARLSAVHRGLADPTWSIHRLVETGGFGTVASLRRQCHALTGLTLGEMRRASACALAGHLVACLIDGDERPDHGRPDASYIAPASAMSSIGTAMSRNATRRTQADLVPSFVDVSEPSTPAPSRQRC